MAVWGGLLGVLISLPGHAGDQRIGEDCRLGGVPLYGRVKVVEDFADFEVQVVEHFADLHVQKVEHFPDRCGRWKMVESFPDFTVKVVDHFADFQIRYVAHFPGVR
jgi:hypothetical protein